MYKKNAASKSIKKAMSFAQFLKRFPNEKACAEYLYNIKWPDGFVCPVCGHRHGYALNRPGRYQCAKCRHQTSITANTVMHRTHLPLTKWFWAIYLVACDKRGISALTLAGRISVSYETAWYLLKRIRMAMEARDAHYTLAGIIEFDDSYASLAIDYYELGVETGKMAAEILLGNKSVSDIEIMTLTPTVVYNEELCGQLGITVPEN